MSAEGAVYDENAYVMALTVCDSEDDDEPPSLVSSHHGSDSDEPPRRARRISDGSIPSLSSDEPEAWSDEPGELDWRALPLVWVPKRLVSYGFSYLGIPYPYNLVLLDAQVSLQSYGEDEADVAACCTVLQMPVSYTRTGNPESSLFADAGMLSRVAAAALEAGRIPPVPATNPFSEAPEVTTTVAPAPTVSPDPVHVTDMGAS